MGSKLGQNITFRPFLGFCSVFGLKIANWSPQFFFRSGHVYGRNHVFWLQLNFLVATNFLDRNWFFFSNLSGPYLLRFNSDLGLSVLVGKLFECRMHP